MQKNEKEHISKEYLCLFLGVFLSFVFNFSFDYFFSVDSVSTNYYYKWSWNSWIITVLYFISTGFFLSLFSPILSRYYKGIYRNIFIIFFVSSLIWIFLLLDDGFKNISGVMQVIIICIPMPLFYIISWRVNIKYWSSKQT